MAFQPLRQISLFLFLVVFLTTNSGTSYGYAWCFGEDGNTRLEQASANGCLDDNTGCADPYSIKGVSLLLANDEHCSPCADLLLDESDAVLSKRSAKAMKVALVTKILAKESPVAHLQKKFSTPVTRPPGIAQTILAHRTVVLLN